MVPILANAVVLIATNVFRATSLKGLCLFAPEAFECSSVANSDVEVQIKMDLTVVNEIERFNRLRPSEVAISRTREMRSARINMWNARS